MLDVKRRAASESPVIRADLENLAQRGLDQRGRHADRGHHPHPEDRARTADGERDRDAGDVSGTHARRKANAKCLKGRDPTVLSMGSPKLAKHAPEIPDLNTPSAHGEINADTDEQVNEDLGVQDIAKRIDQLLLKNVQICFLSAQTWALC